MTDNCNSVCNALDFCKKRETGFDIGKKLSEELSRLILISEHEHWICSGRSKDTLCLFDVQSCRRQKAARVEFVGHPGDIVSQKLRIACKSLAIMTQYGPACCVGTHGDVAVLGHIRKAPDGQSMPKHVHLVLGFNDAAVESCDS